MRHPNTGSLLSKIEPLGPNESLVLPFTSGEHALAAMRRVLAASRYPESMVGRKYTTALVTIVTGVGECTAGLLVTRIETGGVF